MEQKKTQWGILIASFILWFFIAITKTAFFLGSSWWLLITLPLAYFVSLITWLVVYFLYFTFTDKGD